jgi:hypothetical protein
VRKSLRIGIIGGGAAGMVAAVEASRNGAQVTIIERMDRVGKKLLATGNGRCNFTNAWIELTRYRSKDVELASQFLENFSTEYVINYFRDLGIEPYQDETGKIFPYSLQASSMVDVLRDEYLRHGTIEKCGEQVLSIHPSKKRTQVNSTIATHEFDKVVLAMGGKSSDMLGSDGSGFKLLESMGYVLHPTYPALVKLKSDFKHLKALRGLKVMALVRLVSEDGLIGKDFGEVLFADFGVSGPPVLQLSGQAVEEIMKGKSVKLELDLFANQTPLELHDALMARFLKLKHKSVQDSFVGLLNKRLIIPILKESGITDMSIKATQLNKKQVYQIIKTLKSLRLNITNYHSWQASQVTAGGLSLRELNPRTMESKKYAGVHVAGEVLDLYGECGGFNLHWAWCTGIKAGIACSAY